MAKALPLVYENLSVVILINIKEHVTLCCKPLLKLFAFVKNIFRMKSSLLLKPLLERVRCSLLSCQPLLSKDDFDATFGGMETALVEVKRRGKAMMSTVSTREKSSKKDAISPSTGKVDIWSLCPL